MLMFLLVVASIASAAEIIYVDDDASAGGDGSTWDTAFKYLQDGMAVTSYGDEIRVAQGSYIPDQNSVNPSGTGDREATFQLISGVALKGGYAGAGEPDPNERDIEVYETILSGDLAGNDEPDFANNVENSYHVTVSSGTDPNTVLDGLTITGGNADGPWQDRQGSGSGMYNNNGSPTLTNCTFSGNSADGIYVGGGGGMYNNNGSPTLINCTFIDNSAEWSSGGMCNLYGSSTLTNCAFIGNSAGSGGGGMLNAWASHPVVLTSCMFIGNTAGMGGAMTSGTSDTTLINCAFIDNSAWAGGGISGSGGYQGNITAINCTFIGNSADGGVAGGLVGGNNTMVTNCMFIGNSAAGGGGGICASNITLTNCVFIGNSADYNGGGMRCQTYGPTVTNCTFIGNSAGSEGGGIWFGHLYDDNSLLTNCIFWGNSAEDGPQISLFHTTLSVSYSCVQGGWIDVHIGSSSALNWLDGNMGDDLVNDDPLFVDADNSDYHLKSQAGRWDANSESWVTDDVNSPCIDAGDPDSDWSAELWPHGKQINMGAFGGTAQASMSTSAAGNIADLDANDVVNYADLKLFTEGWLRQQVLLSEDIDRDGSVKFKDFAIFAGEWFWEE